MCIDARKYYYAIVWNTTLEKDVRVKGSCINKNTVLVNNSSMLYGANDNDVKKIKVKSYKEKATYNPLTLEQRLEFYTEIEEYEVKRDMRIIIWEGSEEINMLEDSYNIVTPQVFENIVSNKKYEEIEDSKTMILPKGFLDIFVGLKGTKFADA